MRPQIEIGHDSSPPPPNTTALPLVSGNMSTEKYFHNQTVTDQDSLQTNVSTQKPGVSFMRFLQANVVTFCVP